MLHSFAKTCELVFSTFATFVEFRLIEAVWWGLSSLALGSVSRRGCNTAVSRSGRTQTARGLQS